MQWDGFIVDISESGAQLELFDTEGIPEEFSLLVGGHGAVKRLCHVVWRTRDRLGVKFLRGPERASDRSNRSRVESGQRSAVRQPASLTQR